jgi:hypothetical protein
MPKSERVKAHLERTLGRSLTGQEDDEMCRAGFREFLDGSGSTKIGKAMQRAALATAGRSNDSDGGA